LTTSSIFPAVRFAWFTSLSYPGHVSFASYTISMPKKGILRGPMQFTVGYHFQKMLDRDVIKADPTGVNPNYSYGGGIVILLSLVLPINSYYESNIRPYN
jgi:hypothetical protein